MFEWNKLFSIIIISTILLTVKAQDVPIAKDLNVTTPIQDYINLNLLKNSAIIDSYESQIEEFKINYKNLFNSIDIETSLLEAKLIGINDELIPLILLNDLNKHCIQKYRSEIPTIANVKSVLSSCARTQRNSDTSLASSIESTKNTLKTYLSNNLQSSLKNCQTKNSNSQLNYTLCVTGTISDANTYIANNRNLFVKYLEDAKCNGNRYLKTGVDCSFAVLYDSISKISRQMVSIQNCILDGEYEKPCTSNDICDQVLDIPFLKLNSTIASPNLQLNGNSTCLLINFI